MSEKSQKNNSTNITTVEANQIKETLIWLENNSDKIPENPRKIFEACLHIVEKVSQLIESNNLLRKTLGALFGGASKSERASNDQPKEKNKTNSEQLNPDKAAQSQEEKYHGKTSNSKNIQNPKVKKGETKRKKKNTIKTGSKDETNVNLPSEAAYFPLNNSNQIEGNKNKTIELNKHFSDMDKPYLKSEYSERTVVNIKFVVERTKLNVQTVTDTRTGYKVTAEVDEAPPYSNYSYDTILFLIHQHVEYLIPLYRLERMYALLLGISRSTIFRFCNYVAQAFLPVYIFLFTELIQKASFIQMDDTKTKILKQTKEEELQEEAEEDDDSDFNNKDKMTKKLVDQNLSIHKTLHEKIGLLSYVDNKESVKKVNLTFMTGETIPGNPQSRISLFFTHFGQAGDLLEKILIKRKTNANPLDIVCDLASFNQIPPEQAKKYNVRINGCSAHARRYFWKCRKLSDDLYYPLRCFWLLYHIEDFIDGEDDEKILRYRQTYAQKVWKYLIKYCETKIIPMWPKGSAPHKAAKYVLHHREKLMAYLNNAGIPIDNNRSERSIRPEKIMLSNSKFRYNSEGRAIFDVLRSMLTICRHAQINWYTYAADVLRNRETVALNPAQWTPFAWKIKQNSIAAK